MPLRYRCTPHTPPRCSQCKKTGDSSRTMKTTFSEKKLSATSFMKIKSEFAHRLIFHKNIDLCLKNDFETRTFQSAVTHHRLLDYVILQLEMSVEVG